jgi:hypothetical protein
MKYDHIILLIVILLGSAATALICFKLFSLAYTRIKRKGGIPVDKYKAKLTLERVERIFPVRYCSGEKFGNSFNLLPWDASGVFSVEIDCCRFVGENRHGQPLEFHFPDGEVRLSYIEKNIYRDGGLSWFVMENGTEKYFFTSEHGLPEDKKEFTTTGIYEAVADHSMQNLALYK